MKKLIKEYGSELDWESNYEYINRTYPYLFLNRAQYFRSGRDSFRAIALKLNGCYKRILIPALCCNSMVDPFINNGYEVIFYKLNLDISANFEDILSKMQSNTIFLYINYFGITSLNNQKLAYIQEQFLNSILIEDKTHDILFNRGNRYIPDYTICSIRKWVAIPDGGVLWSSKQETFHKEKDTHFENIRMQALKDKSEYLKTGKAQMKKKFRSEFAESNHYLDKNEIVVDISKESFKTLQCIDFQKIYLQRKENAALISRYVDEILGLRNISPDIVKSALYHPIMVDNRDEIQNKLAMKDVYCPIIWPLPKQAIGVCEVAENISNHILAIPCDQRYKVVDIKCICKILSRILRD